MQLDVGGHPIHTRAFAVTVSHRGDGLLEASGYVLDLRQRGFVPAGSDLQGMGIIHHMELRTVVDAATATVVSVDSAQPTVAFEATPATLGESCRDPVGRLAALAGTRLDDGFAAALRATFGGVLGCSHLLALMQLAGATVVWVLRRDTEAFPDGAQRRRAGERIFRRDLVFDGHDRGDTQLAVGIQLSDLHFAPGPAVMAPMERFASQYELRLQLGLEGWPAVVADIRGAQRRRGRASFATAQWDDCADTLARIRGLNLGKGAAGELMRNLGDLPPARDALLMLGPTLIQCRASFPDKWLAMVAATPGHPGLIGLADSCYMWRRGGALEHLRAPGAAATNPDVGKPRD